MLKKEHLEPANIRKTMLLVRKWTSRHDDARTVIAELNTAYKEAGEKERKTIGLLMAMVFDNFDTKLSMECAFRFGHERISGISVAESIFCDRYLDNENFIWRRELKKVEQGGLFVLTDEDRKKLTHIVRGGYINRVIPLFKEENESDIYIMRGADGEMRLLTLNTREDDFLVDEAHFNNEIPFYFTDCTHFCSPVFLAKAMKAIINFVLAEIGYPPVKINNSVVFYTNRYRMFDFDKYANGEDETKEWAGVEVRTGPFSRTQALFPHYLRSMVESNMVPDNVKKLNLILFNALKVAGVMFSYMKKHNFLSDISEDSIKEVALRLGIYE